MYAIQEKAITGLARLHAGLKNKFDNALLKCDAWFPVPVTILLALAFTITAAMAVWCVVYKHKTFTSNWKWITKGLNVTIECR